MDGLKAGIEEKVEAVKKVIKDFVDGFNSIWEKEQEAESPSRVWWRFGLELLQGLAGGIHDNVGLAIGAVTDLAIMLDLELASRLARALIDIGASVRPAISAFNAIAAFKADPNTLARIDEWADLVFLITRRITWMAFQFGPGAIDLGVKLTQIMDDLVNTVLASIEAFSVLGEFEMPTNIVPQLDKLLAIIVTMVIKFQDVATITTKALFAAMEAMVAAVGDVVGLIVPLVEGMTALSDTDFGPIVKGDHLAKQITILRNIIRTIMRKFAEATDEISEGLSNAVSALADAAGKVVDLLKPAIENMTFLSDTDFGPILKEGYHLHDQIEIIRNIVRTTMRLFAEAADEMSTEGMAAVSSYAAAAGDVFGLIAETLEAIGLIAGYIRPLDLRDRLIEFGEDFIAVTNELITALSDIGENLTNSVETTQAMADSITAMLSIVAPAIEALSSFVDFVHIDDAKGKFKAFEQDLTDLFDQLAIAFWLIDRKIFNIKGIVVDLAEKINAMISIVVPAIAALAALAEFTQIDNVKEKSAAFREDMEVLFDELGELFWLIDRKIFNIKGIVVDLAEKINAMIGVIIPAINALEALGDLEIEDVKKEVTHLFQQIELIIDEVVRLFGVDPEIVTNAALFSESMATVLSSVLSAVTSMNALLQENVPDGLVGILEQLQNILLAIVIPVYDIGLKIGESFMKGITDGITAGFDALNNVIDTLMAAIGGSGVGGTLGGVGDRATMGATGGMTTNLNMGGLTFNTTIQDQMTQDEFEFRVVEVIRGLV